MGKKCTVNSDSTPQFCIIQYTVVFSIFFSLKLIDFTQKIKKYLSKVLNLISNHRIQREFANK